MKTKFSQTVSYNRFIELQQASVLPTIILLKDYCSDGCTGILFINSTPTRVCKNKRIFNHKVFKGLVQRGKSAMGYFYGFKLHFVINDKGEILNFIITYSNIDDREPLKNKRLLKNKKVNYILIKVIYQRL